MRGYELVVVWTTGEKEVIFFQNEEKAKEAAIGYHKVFGNQIEWTGIRVRRV